MQTVGDQLLAGAALADHQHRLVQLGDLETCSKTSTKAFASPNKFSGCSFMMKFANVW